MEDEPRRPTLIIVSGPPGAGKSTIGLRIATEFRLPLMSKDAIKESLFDTLGWDGREWSKRVGMASLELLYDFVEEQLQVDRSVIAESNFYREFDAPKLSAIQSRQDCSLLEVYCTAANSTLMARYVARVESGERHPGHVDSLIYHEVREKLEAGAWSPLNVDGNVHLVDTNDMATVDYDALFAAIAAALNLFS